MDRLQKWIRLVLTRTEYRMVGRGKKIQCVELPPSERLVFGLQFAFVALVVLVVLEALHMVCWGSFNSEIFAAIMGVIGTIFGVFLSAR